VPKCKFTISGTLRWKGAVVVDAHGLLEPLTFTDDHASHDVPAEALAWFTFWVKGEAGTKLSVSISKQIGDDEQVLTKRSYTLPASAELTRDIQFFAGEDLQ
jgi:hypothetical protein